ncbi:unnamed protein product [Effrenium voratum]|uniref:Methyltransferase domain-containing protein n=1 Tax=Effrenium voratum TaxID=2562239 RepID=A0AA36I9A4_9DINO|nr:unnamed protein product [Effrenium voratum]
MSLGHPIPVTDLHGRPPTSLTSAGAARPKTAEPAGRGRSAAVTPAAFAAAAAACASPARRLRRSKRASRLLRHADGREVLAALHPALAEAAEAVWRGEVLLAGPKEEIGGVKGVAAGETGEPQLLRELQPDSYDLVLEVQSDEVLAAGWEAWCNRFYPLGGHSFSLANSFIINLASIAKVLRTGGKFIFLTTAESKDEILPFAFLQLPHLKWQIEQLPAHASGVSAVCCTLQADAAQALRSTPQVVAEQCTAETSRRRYFEALRPYLKGESAALRILDYGCGDGSLMSWAYDEEILAEDGPPPAVTLLEANPELAARAKAKLRLAEVIHHEGEDWPFEDGAFDVAVVAFVLHHVPLEARRSLLREARRVARKVLVLEDLPGAEAASARLAWQVTQEHFRPFGQDPEDFLPHVWPWDRWLQLFDEAGLSSRSSRRIAGSLRYPVPHILFELENNILARV